MSYLHLISDCVFVTSAIIKPLYHVSNFTSAVVQTRQSNTSLFVKHSSDTRQLKVLYRSTQITLKDIKNSKGLPQCSSASALALATLLTFSNSFFASFTLHALCLQVSELNCLQRFLVLIFITNVFFRIICF